MKKKLIHVLALIITSATFAQLNVRNDNYIYADNALLFVKQNVNIQDGNSKLYLRNGAQLLQEDNVGNTGLGELSVQQTGTVNQFAYNYWCSPIGESTIAVGNEDFRVALIDEPDGLINSFDVEFTNNVNSSASPLTISERWLYTYVTGTTYTDWNPVGRNGLIAPGLGFTMKGVGAAATGNQVYDFRGKPHNGNITSLVADGSLTLIGNPYPSALDAALFINDPANISAISGELYFWEQQAVNSHFLADYIGGYATLLYGPEALGYPRTFNPAVFSTYDGAGNPLPLPPPGANGSKIAYRYQPIGQGFLVLGSVNGNVTVKNEHRVFVQEATGNSLFFRDAETVNPNNQDIFNQVPENFKRFRINVDFNDLYTRQLVQNFHHTATDGFDRGLEGHRPGGPASDAYWTLDEDKFVIQAHDYRETLRIPLEVHAETNQPLRFRMLDVQNFDDQQPIYLYDSKYDLYVNLKEQHYNINIEAGNYSNRFEITFNRGTLSNEEFKNAGFRVVQDNNNAHLILMNPTLMDVQSFKLIDMSGKEIINISKLGIQPQYNVNTSKLSDGIYIASIKSTSGNTLSRKIIVKN